MNIVCLGLPRSEGNWFDDLNSGFEAIPGAQLFVPGPGADIAALFRGLDDCRERILAGPPPDIVLLPDPIVGDLPAWARARAHLGFPWRLATVWHGRTRVEAGLALALPEERRTRWFAWRAEQNAQLSRLLLTEVDLVFCATSVEMESLLNEGIERPRICAVGFPVRAAARSSLAVRPARSPPRVAFPHRLASNRGLSRLEAVVDALAEFRFLILRPSAEEPGTQADGLADTVTRLRKHPRVDFDVCMTKQSYFDALAACDVVLSLSTQESFGVAVVEAMALGLPPVLPCLPAYRELMHGTERFLFEDVTQIPDLVRAAVEHRLEIGPMVRGLAERFAPAAFAARVRSALDGFFQGGVS